MADGKVKLVYGKKGFGGTTVKKSTPSRSVRLELRDRDELQLVRALLGLHVRRSTGRLSAGSAVVARRLLRRLDQ